VRIVVGALLILASVAIVVRREAAEVGREGQSFSGGVAEPGLEADDVVRADRNAAQIATRGVPER
jgi:hypothetical protein